jgi:hypothetical protein
MLVSMVGWVGAEAPVGLNLCQHCLCAAFCCFGVGVAAGRRIVANATVLAAIVGNDHNVKRTCVFRDLCGVAAFGESFCHCRFPWLVGFDTNTLQNKKHHCNTKYPLVIRFLSGMIHLMQ